jgi:hypothetical protein
VIAEADAAGHRFDHPLKGKKGCLKLKDKSSLARAPGQLSCYSQY